MNGDFSSTTILLQGISAIIQITVIDVSMDHDVFASFFSFSVNFSSSYYHRGCVQVAAGDAQTCVTSTDREKSGLNRLLGGDSRLSVYDFAGQYCLCASDLCNGQGKIGQVGVEKLGWTAGVVIGILVLRVYSILP